MINSKGIAGRHLAMISKLNCEDLRRYGMNVGDVMDLIELVKQKVTETASTIGTHEEHQIPDLTANPTRNGTPATSVLPSAPQEAGPSSSGFKAGRTPSVLPSAPQEAGPSSSGFKAGRTPSVLPSAPQEAGPSSSGFKAGRTPSVVPSAPQEAGPSSSGFKAGRPSSVAPQEAGPSRSGHKAAVSDVDLSFDPSLELNFDEATAGNERGDDRENYQLEESNESSTLESDDEVFHGFASRSEVQKVSSYDRKIFRNTINKYKFFLSKDPNYAMSKPTLQIIGAEQINCVSDSDCDSDSTAKRKRKKNTKDRFSKPEENMTKKRKAAPPKSSSKKTSRSVEKAALKEEHKAFLNCSRLSTQEKTVIKKYLQNKLNHTYSISEMLSAEAKNDKAIEEVQSKLQEEGVVFEGDCKKLIEALMENLYTTTNNINLITTTMREGLAVSLVATYPKMCHEALTPDDLPWSWIYDRRNNKGKFANYHANKQRTSDSRMRCGKTSKSASKKTHDSKKSQEPVVSFCHINDLQLSKDAVYLRMLMPDDKNQNEVEKYMKSTFKERRTLALDGRCPLKLLLEAFPKLADFGGRMIDYEFDLLFPNKGTLFLRNYQDIVPKLLDIAEGNSTKYPEKYCLQFTDMSLNSLVILSKFLPKPKRVDDWEESMNPLPELEDFFHVVPLGTDLHDNILKKREDQNGHVQPYIIAVGTTRKIERMSLVLGDGKFVLLPPSTMPLKAVDLLIKAHFVLNTHFYLGWKYVIRFLTANIFKIPPENPRHATFSEYFMQLTS